MSKKTKRPINQIKLYKRNVKWYRFERYIRTFCLLLSYALVVTLILSYYFNSLDSIHSKAFQSISDVKLNVINKPQIIIEHEDGSYYNLVSDEAVLDYSDKMNLQNIDMNNVTIHSDFGRLTADNLEIKDNLDVLHFTGNPVLIIEP